MWDDPICWPQTPLNTTISVQCPPIKGYDTTSKEVPCIFSPSCGILVRNSKFCQYILPTYSEMISKYCDPSGLWRENETDDDEEYWHSQTNIVVCFTEEILKILDQINQLPEGGFEVR